MSIRSDHKISTLLKSIKKYDIQYERKKCSPFVFTKVPRTASTTISQELKIRAKGYLTVGRFTKLNELINLKNFNIFNLNYDLNHMRIQAAINKNKKIINILENSFCFLFIRNPFDRMVSLWKLHCHSIIPNSTNKQGIYFGLSFEDFVIKYLKDKRSDKNKNIFYTLERQLGDSQWRWMHQWINYIGRYEHLEKDFNYIKQKLNLKNKNNKIKYKTKRYKTNKINQKDYKTFYNKKLIEVVSKHYEIDCKLFGYTFNKCTKTQKQIVKDTMKFISSLIKNDHKINKLL